QPSFELDQEPGKEVSHMPAVLFTKDGKRLITGTSAGEVIVWDAATRAILRRVKFADSAVAAIAVVPDRLIVALLAKGTLVAGDFATGKVVAANDKVAGA